MPMSKKLVGDLGQALYQVACRADTHAPTLWNAVNALVDVLDNHGQDFRLFLKAAGADDEEQAEGRIGA